MIRKLTSIILIVTILAAITRSTIPYVWYYANYEYIAHELCENRDHPEKDCNGSCQLTKMIQNQHDHDDQRPAPPVEQERKINLFFADYISYAIPLSFSLPFHDEDNYLESLWTEEPVSPPPQAA